MLIEAAFVVGVGFAVLGCTMSARLKTAASDFGEVKAGGSFFVASRCRSFVDDVTDASDTGDSTANKLFLGGDVGDDVDMELEAGERIAVI